MYMGDKCLRFNSVLLFKEKVAHGIIETFDFNKKTEMDKRIFLLP